MQRGELVSQVRLKKILGTTFFCFKTYCELTLAKPQNVQKKYNFISDDSEFTTGRALRTSPIFPKLQVAGAQFGQVIQIQGHAKKNTRAGGRGRGVDFSGR